MIDAVIIILALVTLQRLGELVIAQRNTAGLLAKGGIEIGRAHYPLIVVFHAVWLLGLWWLAPGRPVVWWLIGVFAVLQALRVWVLATLGSRWTTRVIVIPGEKLVARGPYRFLRHPNYLVVALEIFVLPLAFGLTTYALIFGVLNLALLAYRISVEGSALNEMTSRNNRYKRGQCSH